MKLLLFSDLDLFTVSNQDFPHTLNFLNSKVSLCKLTLVNVKAQNPGEMLNKARDRH